MEKIYITKNGYYYSYVTGKMFKPSAELAVLLNNIKNKDELQQKYIDGEIPEELYQRLVILLFDKESDAIKFEQNKELGKLQLIVTNNCNMRCKYCYAHAGTYDQAKQPMSIEVAKNAVDFFFEKYERIQNISFFGGEPLLNIDLIDYICDYIKHKYKGRYTSLLMMSNLFFLDDKACKVIKKHKIRVTSSLDGDEVCNNKNRVDIKGNGTFERVYDNIIKLRKMANQPEAIEATLTKVNSDNEMNPLNLAHYFYEQFGITCSSGVIARIYSENIEAYEDKANVSIQEYLDAYIDKGLVTEYAKNFLLLIQGKQVAEEFCDAGLGQFTIMPNGDIFPCQMFAMIDDKKYCMGNLDVDHDIVKKIEETQKELKKFSKGRNDKCMGCELKSNCSKCVADILYTNNKFILSDQECEKFLVETNKYIEYYSELYEDKTRWKQFMSRVIADNELWKSI